MAGPSAPPAAPATLLHAGGRAFVGPEGVTIGRAEDNTIVVASDMASRHHARVYSAPDGYRIADLGSSNGTYLNGEPLTGPQPLHPGDRIRIGDNEFSYVH